MFGCWRCRTMTFVVEVFAALWHKLSRRKVRAEGLLAVVSHRPEKLASLDRQRGHRYQQPRSSSLRSPSRLLASLRIPNRTLVYAVHASPQDIRRDRRA